MHKMFYFKMVRDREHSEDLGVDGSQHYNGSQRNTIGEQRPDSTG